MPLVLWSLIVTATASVSVRSNKPDSHINTAALDGSRRVRVQHRSPQPAPSAWDADTWAAELQMLAIPPRCPTPEVTWYGRFCTDFVHTPAKWHDECHLLRMEVNEDGLMDFQNRHARIFGYCSEGHVCRPSSNDVAMPRIICVTEAEAAERDRLQDPARLPMPSDAWFTAAEQEIEQLRQGPSPAAVGTSRDTMQGASSDRGGSG